ncbi:alpha/beta hydrolase [Pedobacter sp. PF22-3]|uniref:T9SS type A sorting domain-containing protein n=1 Tax=Pedobacter sp. PF22-3 TaxID=2994467 RepID=UPI002247212E|nr:T9SS type A sorting domain-containing protein [Pedobacter sp. PF22-3]MCX2495523.1 alpha/beta hydrolase [Pedobacter sp. PF22-3]
MRIILLLLLFPILGFGQNLRVRNYNESGIQHADSLWFTDEEYFSYSMGQLNFSEVLSHGGYLIEKSQAPFIANKFDGLNGDDIAVNSTTGLGIYSSFYNSYLSSPNPLLNASALVSAAQPLLKDHIIPIFFLNHQYCCIDSNALNNGLFTTNTDHTILYDNPARTASPYLLQRLFIGGPYVNNNSYHSTGEVTFKFSQDFVVSDQTISYLEIDFGDGSGFRGVGLGQQQTVNYTASGLKTIKIRMGGRVCISEFHFIKDEIFEGSLATQAQSQNLRAAVAGASTFMQLGCDGVLDKPVLIIEGLEIESVSDPGSIFGSVNRPAGNFLLTRLRELNYDIIVVKFANNNASITANAAVLENVINEVNAEKTGISKLHIIGLSMGGLIAKYCLKDMEDRSLTHNVANYFSYDSPHQGAYVPIGIQWLLNDASYAVKDIRENPLVERILGVLNSTAAKQLLQVGINNPERAYFAASYYQKGYPSQCNNYGIANGRGDGIGLGYGNGSQLMDFNATTKFWFISALKHKEQLWTTNTSVSDVSYVSNSGFAPLFGLQGLRSYSSRVKFAGLVPHETVPGSTVNMVPLYGNGLFDGFKKQTQATLNLYGREVTSFVPTVSALDLSNQDYALDGRYISRNPYFNIQAGNVVANNITPFDDVIFATGVSQDHLQMDINIANFIMQKIHGSIPVNSCTTGCISNPPSFTTEVANTACHDQDVLMANYPPGVSIQWTVPAGVKLLYGQGTNRIRINSQKAGVNNLTVSIKKPDCTPFVYNVPVNIQQPVVAKPAFIRGELPNACRYSIQTFSIDPVPGATSYHWTTNWGELFTASNGTEVSIDFSATDAPDYQPYQLTVIAINDCGESEPLVVTGYLVDCHSSWLAYPNPANTEVNLEPIEKPSQSARAIDKTRKVANKGNVPFEAIIYNDKGRMLKQIKSKTSIEPSKISVADLPNGTYYLHIIENTKVIKSQLLIQH